MKELKMSEKVTTAIVVLFVIGVGVWNIFFGVKGLFLSKQHPMEDVFDSPLWEHTYEGTIECVSNQTWHISRQIRYRWAGDEDYYIIFSKERDKAIIVRAPRNWKGYVGGDKFNDISLEEKGIVRDLRFNVRERLADATASLQEEGIHINPTIYLDLLAKRICVVQLFVGIAVLVLVLYFFLLVRNLRKSVPKPTSKPLFIFMMILMLMIIAAFFYLRNKTW